MVLVKSLKKGKRRNAKGEEAMIDFDFIFSFFYFYQPYQSLLIPMEERGH